MVWPRQVLHGGENLLDKVEQLKQRSAATKTQLEVATRQQAEQQRRLEELQLERLDMDAQYSSLEVCHEQAGTMNVLSLSLLWPLLDD